MMEREAAPSSSAVHGRAAPPRVVLAARGVAIGIRWSGVEGAGNQILAAKVECEPERARLVRIWRPFTDAPGRRDVVGRFGPWLAEEARWAEGRLAVGVDFALSLSETHLRQLGLLRQALRGPATLGRHLHDRFVGASGDFTESAARFRAELGRDRPRVTDCYRGEQQLPTSPRAHRQTFFGLCAMAQTHASFVPWDPPAAGRPVIAEVRPGHVARALLGACSYRDDDRDGVARASIRAAILRTLRSSARLEFEMEQAAQIVEDGHGDHLDAVLGATGVAAAWGDDFQGVPSNVPRPEGWIHSIREEPWR
jgi:hypothetical protein